MARFHVNYIPFFNNVTLGGAVFSEPILRTLKTEEGKDWNVLNFILLNRHPTNPKRSVSIPVVVFKNAEYVYSRIKYGDPVIAAGELRSEEAKKVQAGDKRRWEYRLWASRVTKLYKPLPGEVVDFEPV